MCVFAQVDPLKKMGDDLTKEIASGQSSLNDVLKADAKLGARVAKLGHFHSDD